MLLSPSLEGEVCSCISLSLSAVLQVLWSSSVLPSSLVLFSKPQASRDLEYIMSHQCSEAGDRFIAAIFILFHKASQAEWKLPVVSPLPTSRSIYAVTLVPYE